MRQRSAAPPDQQRPEQAASTWLQVAFGGMSVTIALVAAVIAYFAWVQPHEPGAGAAAGDTGRRAGEAGNGTPTGTTAARGSGEPATKKPITKKPATKKLASLEPTLGGTNLRRSGNDLVLPCATGQTTDRQRTVEYDLFGRYATAEAALTVTRARDGESPAQIKILADGLVATTVTVTRNHPARLNVPLAGRQKMRLQLTCQFPDSEVTIGNATLIHS
ncbi:hypothetical protein [Paractinoplanes rishiriensis]|uniref:Glycosyl hydrolase family 98 putative carbohydrate-binding module domain-containing protein n=1 Tax=Paractinoplanes rishiriensis TaxID=1050105 RepID=A0A919JR24_9ACTN|nr:hypothetical protein [Actinoplanes rishiriensis]GIE93541.1 hypothetical protein Ari01nite_10060 [Actinoplanes rishiriensis]